MIDWVTDRRQVGVEKSESNIAGKDGGIKLLGAEIPTFPLSRDYAYAIS